MKDENGPGEYGWQIHCPEVGKLVENGGSQNYSVER